MMIDPNINESLTNPSIPNQNTPSGSNCITHWVGRCVRHCPGGHYTAGTYVWVKVSIMVIGALFFSILPIANAWKDEMSETQKHITAYVGILGLIGSIIAYLVNEALFKINRSRNSNIEIEFV